MKTLAVRVLDKLGHEPVLAAAVAGALGWFLKDGADWGQVWLIIGSIIPRQFVTPDNKVVNG